MRTVLKVNGMSCVNCARTIERTLTSADGVEEVEVSFELGRVTVSYDPAKISEDQIARLIENLGYRVIDERGRRDLLRLIVSLLSSALIVILILTSPPGGIYLQAVLSTLVQIFAGWKFYRGAYASLKNRVAGMDVLVSLGTTGAYLYSMLVLAGVLRGEPFFETNSLLITFVLAGRLIEEFAKKRSLKLLSGMLSVHKSEVTVLRDGKEEKVNVREVFKGDVILCRTGDMVPLDGVVVKGSAWVSEAVMTGEPEPILKKEGSRVISGSIVEGGVVEVRVESSFESSYLTKISRIVESAISEKPPIQRIVDRVSHYFVQAVILVALLVFFLWMINDAGLQKATMFSLAVIVISCPCALGIATPLAIVMGVSLALSRGVLIKKPPVLEAFSRVDTVVFDKTGTVTEGAFRVVSARIYDDRALDIALTLEKVSNHPIARAIRQYALSKGAKEIPLGECREVIGRGVECGEYFIGASKSSTEEDGLKVVELRKGDEVLARFEVSDRLDPSAPSVVRALKEMGLKTLLLSGDRKAHVEEVAKKIGFDSFKGEVKPEEKRDLIIDLQRRGHTVAMVGDGVNDAPAMAQADISFAVAQGTDITKQVGDVLLLGGIRQLPYVFSLGKRVRRKIFQNLGWAFIYNVIGIPVAGGLLSGMGIYLKPEIAGLMMVLSSVSVVLNTVLLRYNISFPKPESEERVAQSPRYGSHSAQRVGAS